MDRAGHLRPDRDGGLRHPVRSHRAADATVVPGHLPDGGELSVVRRGRRVWQRRRRRRRLAGLRRRRRRGHGRGGRALARQRRAVRIRRRPIGGRRHAAHLADDQQLLRLAGGGGAGRRIRRRAVLVRGPAAAGRPGHVGHPPDRPAHDRERSVPAAEADRDRGHAGSAHQRVGARERARGPDQLRRGRDQPGPARLVQLRPQLRSAAEGSGERGGGERVRGRIRDAGDQLGPVVHGAFIRALPADERDGAAGVRLDAGTVWVSSRPAPCCSCCASTSRSRRRWRRAA